MRRALAIASCALGLAIFAPTAQAAFNDPLFVFTPSSASSSKPPPAGELQGPCGLGVDSLGRFYVSDYYHHTIDLYSGSAGYASSPTNGATGYIAQLASEDPLDGPCGLALDGSNNLYVNNYHRNVAKFGPAAAFSPGPIFDTAEPTGVATDPSGHVFVDDRSSIAEYATAGTLLGRIGEGSLTDGYGVAVSAYSGSTGRIYVPDAASDTVKVYDPAIGTTTPYAEIGGPAGGFGSLVDSAVAVDNTSGEVYVIDTLGPQYSEHPQATVYVFDAAGAYEGRLKYNVVDGSPSGLAVDNSATSTQGRVYVTSGASTRASIYAYPPGAASSAAAPPLGLSSASTPPEPMADGQSASSVALSSATPSVAPAAKTSDTRILSAAVPSGSKQRAHRHRRAHHGHYPRGHRGR
jgi:hypothetical protein